MTPEFSRLVNVRGLPAGTLRLEANANERVALAKRVGVEAVERLEAEVTLENVGSAVEVSGRLIAELVQRCAIANEPFAVGIDEPLALRFVQGEATWKPGEEIELEIDSEASDEIEFTGTQFDLGEEITQSLALAIDPYATGPDANRAREEAGLGDASTSGPFTALAALKRRD